ncbi:aquaporin transporter, putative [Talaromyces stipitatus ATCC 10500]|uniref:Aquaporin transporter, putative n=1 Tax=Talaromyces stipitatus (strain ATCC 10500 / CBS 375.48 / QM 6759 / NRRL 1006) TaxID=441959 RepID=B8MJX8_TALSN|nr:aquaporin transporter, putative [Talaromyces stipitatus ATCC 10500]EED14795.1 aquaporin transporter, putative [Talaromyces stipitatus ATCC 10500]
MELHTLPPDHEKGETKFLRFRSWSTPLTGVHPAVQPFAGRIGGNQALVLDRNDPKNTEYLKAVPDAAPFMRVSEALDLRGFLDWNLWKFAIVEGVASFLLIFITGWIAIRPRPASSTSSSTEPTAAGVFGTSTFLGPLIGGITNWLFLTLFIYSFAPISGGHINPTITLATFFARLISLPRMTLYLMGQTGGGALAGLVLHNLFGSSNFVVGGCFIETNLVEVRQALLLEFMCTLTLVFIAFGVALNPRQERIFGPALAPWLVGLTLGLLSWSSSYEKPGYAGASMNPARCFGVYVGSGFPGYHWIHWVGVFCATLGHGLFYQLLPPWTTDKK